MCISFYFSRNGDRRTNIFFSYIGIIYYRQFTISIGQYQRAIFRYFGNLLAVKDKVLIRGCVLQLQKSSCTKMMVE